MKQVKRIIERFVKNPDDGQLANLLLEQFHSGAPLELLLPLLLSPDEEIASSAAWIASELGPHGESLLDVVSISRDSWVKLEVPASLVGLEGHILNGMAFSMWGGRATWDRAGKTSSGGVGSSLQWLVSDQLGTPRMIIDEAGTLANVKRHDYLPFGEELETTIDALTKPTVPIQSVAPTCNCEKET